jgi:hypothetical protein
MDRLFAALRDQVWSPAIFIVPPVADTRLGQWDREAAAEAWVAVPWEGADTELPCSETQQFPRAEQLVE